MPRNGDRLIASQNVYCLGASIMFFFFNSNEYLHHMLNLYCNDTYRCLECGGDGRVTCDDCDGYGKLKCFIQLKVKL